MPLPTAPRRAAIVCLAVAVVASSSPRVHAWGRIGHRAAARVAESRLTPAARAAIQNLLDPGETLADASTWADEQRQDRPETGAWHYVNVPITLDRYDRRFCSPDGCVVGKIVELRATLAAPNTPREQKREALRFLVHFIEDMHQPLHVGDRMDRGGNDLQLQFFGEGTNLHRLWDSGVIEHESADEATWTVTIDALATPERTRDWVEGAVEDWATESLIQARRAYRHPSSGSPLVSGGKLGQEYQDFALPIVKERLARSAARLAFVLNEVFR
jgi:hypothetical protein